MSYALDNLTYLDDIDLTFLEDETAVISQTDLTQEEIDSFRIKPFKHPVEAINYGLNEANEK